MILVQKEEQVRYTEDKIRTLNGEGCPPATANLNQNLPN
jgi:hypothetical protein